MEQSVQFSGRPLTLELSRSAEAELQRRSSPLLVEMELYFSCLIRKQLRFYEHHSSLGEAVHPQLSLRFHPVMTRHCTLDTSANANKPELTDFPIEAGERFVPRWLRLDFRNGRWQGEFGYGKGG
jgi:hypothetical protein